MSRYDLDRAWFRTPNGRSVLMHIREGTNDWNTCQAAMTQDEYGLRGMHLTGRAIDIGAHLGAVTISLLIDNPDLVVDAVEPIPENVYLLRLNAAQNQVADRLAVHEAAAGDGGTVTIRYAYEDNENDLHHAFIGNSGLVSDTARQHREATVRSLTTTDLPPCSFMKIDCEGGEWPFLTGGVRPELCPLIVGEWHPVDGHARDDLVALLPGYDITFTGPEGGPGGFRATATSHAGGS